MVCPLLSTWFVVHGQKGRKDVLQLLFFYADQVLRTELHHVSRCPPRLSTLSRMSFSGEGKKQKLEWIECGSQRNRANEWYHSQRLNVVNEVSELGTTGCLWVSKTHCQLETTVATSAEDLPRSLPGMSSAICFELASTEDWSTYYFFRSLDVANSVRNEGARRYKPEESCLYLRLDVSLG